MTLKIRNLMWFPLVILVFASCQYFREEKNWGRECIPPIVELSYPVRKDVGLDDPEFSNIYLPEDISIEQHLENEWYSSITFQASGELWITPPITKYNPNTKEIQEYEIQTVDGNLFTTYYLLVSKDNFLWGLGQSVSLETGIQAGLVRFDEESDAFEIVLMIDDLYPNVSNDGSISHFRVGPDGTFWFFFDNKLFNFDPITIHLEQILDETYGYYIFDTSLAISSNNNVWIVGRTTEDDTVYILQIDPQSRDIIRHKPSRDIDQLFGSDFFIDHMNRLWINDYGFLEYQDSHAQWNQVIRSPIFITTNTGSSGFSHSWIRPIPKLETVERYVWFSGLFGLARLDLENSNWCLLTTIPVSEITEDSNGYVWVVSSKGLLKFAQAP